MIRRVAVAATVALAVAAPGVGGCGEGDCLTAEEVQEQVDEIASGFETSEEDVAAKQEEIAEIRARECP